MLNSRMMQIADNPTDRWVEEYSKAHGYEVFKFGQPSGKRVQTGTTVKFSGAANDTVAVPDFDAQSGFIKHLATKVRI